VRVFALWHAFARNIRDRKRVALQHRDLSIKIRQRPRGQQAAHARADHDRVLADPFHDAPALATSVHSPGSGGTVRRQDRFCLVAFGAITKSSVRAL
jgi:hypothetical protein